jgi:hypothetical protein
MAPRRTTSAPAAVVPAPISIKPPARVHHLVVSYEADDPDAYNPEHTVTLTITGQVNVRMVAFYGKPGQNLAVYLVWGSNTRTINLKSGSPTNLLALISPDAAGNSSLALGPSVHRTIPSGPTTLTLQFYDADLPMGSAAIVYPDNFTAVLEVTPLDA